MHVCPPLRAMTAPPPRLSRLLRLVPALLALALTMPAARAATLTVTNTNDGGPGSLRAAVASAQPGDTINFSVTGTIALTSGQITIGQPITIYGPGVAVDGSHSSRVFEVSAGTAAQPVTINGLTIQNASTSGNGGGVAVDSGRAASLTGCTLTGNGGNVGGGLFNQGTTTLTGCTLTGNSGRGGGGLYNGGTASLTRCTFSGNGGGGVHNTNNSTVTLTGCVLSGNSGSGIAAFENFSTASLTGCTITGNSSSDGGVETFNGPLTLTDDIVYGNTNGGINSVSGSVSVSYSDIQGGHTGTGNLNADPKFVSSTDPHLQSTSPCVGAGVVVPGVTYDVTGVPYFAPPSIGAYEYVSQTLVVLTTNDVGGDPNNLRYALAAANAAPHSLITFDPAVFNSLRTITLTGGQLTVSASTAILAPAAGVAVDGGGANSVFNVTAGLSAVGLTLQHGGGSYGGGAQVGGGAALALTGCVLSGNSATRGGALYNTGTVTLTGCVLSGNSASLGGALNGSGPATLTDCVLSGNSAVSTGAALNATGGRLTVTGCTLTGNRLTGGGSQGGGLYAIFGAQVTLTDDIFWGDSAAADPEIHSDTPSNSTTVTVSHCDVQGGLPSNVTDAGGNLGADPRFVSGTDLHLLPGSPVIGLGTTSAPNNSYLPYDYDGTTRANPPSLGAYEGVAAATSTTLALTTGSNPSAAGQTVTFTATVSNTSSGITPVGSVSFTVDGTSGSPVALDANGQATLTASSLSVGPHTVSAAFAGDARFTASASGGLTQSVVGTPTANPQSVGVPFNTATSITLTGSDPDSPPRSLTYAVGTGPAHGSLSSFSAATGAVTYTPTAGYHGADSFTFTVSNGVSTSSPATVSIMVATGTPTANGQSVGTNQDTPVGITLTGSDPDVPALPLTYAVATGPSHGTLTGFNAATGAVTYTPNGGYSGPDSFTFAVSNGTNTSSAATVSLTVNHVNATVTGAAVAWGTAGTATLQTAGDGLRLLPSGRNTDLPWQGVKSVTVTLSSAAPLSPADVSVTGIRVANYGPVTVTGSGTTYTLTFARPISAADRVTVTVGSANVTAYTRRLDVLPGDVSDDGAVNASDMAVSRNQIVSVSPATIFGDTNGDGSVTMTDYNIVHALIGTTLP